MPTQLSRNRLQRGIDKSVSCIDRLIGTHGRAKEACGGVIDLNAPTQRTSPCIPNVIIFFAANLKIMTVGSW
jgi:hypothetical protein